MNLERRNSIRLIALVGLMASTGLISLAEAEEWNKEAFSGKSFDDVIKVLGKPVLEKSNLVKLSAPEIAEDGAVVPVSISTTLNAMQIAIIVENNPNALAALFIIPEGTESFVATRVKMKESSTVYALVQADGKWYLDSKNVKVTMGGCGG